MKATQEFFNLYNHDFVRAAVAIPPVRVADPDFNAGQTIALMREAAARQAALVLFPELGLSAYSCEDLFQQRALLDACAAALGEVVRASAELPVLAVVGMPLAVDHQLYNCAVVVGGGRIHGVVPKTYLPNYREFYELRQFRSGDVALREEIDVGEQRHVPFGARLLFEVEEQPLLRFHVEICEDLWVPIPPSSYAALAGATVLLNLSASNVTVAKADYRRELVGSQSARCLAAYLYSAAGPGESTTDLAWDGHALVYENGTLARPSLGASRASPSSSWATSISSASRRSACARGRSGRPSSGTAASSRDFRVVRTSLALPRRGRLLPERRYERFPYVPADPVHPRSSGAPRCSTSRCRGWSSGWSSPGSERVVIGVSGGLDSTHALLVCAQAMDLLGHSRAQHPRLHHARLRHERADPRSGAAPDGGRRLRGQRAGHPAERAADAARHRASRPRTARPSTTSPSRTCRPGSAPATSSAWPTTGGLWSWAPAISASWPSAGAPTASAITCRTTP